MDKLNKGIKHKLNDDGVYESFLHPRVIKTDVLVLKRAIKPNDKSQSGRGEPEPKKLKGMKHSFQVVE